MLGECLRKSKTRWLGIGLLGTAALLAGGAASAAYPVSGNGIVPTLVPGNPTCTGLGYAYGIRIDPPTPGDYVVGTGTFTWTTPDKKFVNWSSTFAIDAVIVKGGDDAHVYVYDPESKGPDTNLASPLNSGGNIPDISHVDVCFDYEVVVGKTVSTSFDRDWTWEITKVLDNAADVPPGGVVLNPPDDTFHAFYTVTVTPSAQDSNFSVSGTITVFNPDPGNSATILSVTDAISGGFVPAVSCGVTFPYVLAPGETLNCTYGPLALPDGNARTNTATAATQGAVGGGSVEEPVTFAAPGNETDECVDVSDPVGGGALGEVCRQQATFEYDTYWTLTPEACEAGSFDNTATFVTNDTGTTEDASVSIPIAEGSCERPGGCTLTQGYWKTHSAHGPAPHDDAWGGLEDQPFFNSGKTYYEVLWTPPAGNAYYNLAHQYIAAVLNIGNGADPADAQAAIDWATQFFGSYTPTNWPNAKRKEVLSNATILDNYNNGVVGPGHCSESE